MLRYDLHCHSTHSDGLLAPPELVRRAVERGVDVLALTDHDELSGLAEAGAASDGSRLTLIGGTEISVTWRELTLHVLGLRIDAACAQLRDGLARIRVGRSERARRIGASLAEAGIPDAYEGALAFVTSERLVSRTHFARFLVETGHVREVKDAFKRYLTRGKPGYVEHAWAALPEVIGWIHAAGGRAVLAHPGRYKLSPAGLRELLAEFRDFGGDGLEILSPSHGADQVADFAAHARKLGLLASSGSDYHGPDESYVDLGDMPELPSGVTPVWHDW